MSGCYVYGSRVADKHLWETKADLPPGESLPTGRGYGQGPLCIRCGLPRGTYAYEEKCDREREQRDALPEEKP